MYVRFLQYVRVEQWYVDEWICTDILVDELYSSNPSTPSATYMCQWIGST